METSHTVWLCVSATLNACVQDKPGFARGSMCSANHFDSVVHEQMPSWHTSSGMDAMVCAWLLHAAVGVHGDSGSADNSRRHCRRCLFECDGGSLIH